MEKLSNDLTHKQNNLKAIHERLKPIAETDEIAQLVQSDYQGIFIIKREGKMELYCYDEDTHKLSDSMSRIDLEKPLELLSPYMQGAFTTAFWSEKPPENIYIAGFGGGCLALEWHHFFPKVQIDGSEIDQTILDVAKKYFAAPFDERVDVKAIDGRLDFDSRNQCYDIIIVDVFFGGGDHANHLATQEFFSLCKSKLSKHGVLCANIIELDPLHREKVKAIQSVFDHCYGWNVNGACVTFASQQPLDKAAMLKRVQKFMKNEGLQFPAIERVKAFKELTIDDEVTALSDSSVTETIKLAG